MDKRRNRGLTILLIILTAALVCLAVFFITGMFDLIGEPQSSDSSQKTGTLNGEPLSVTWTQDADGLVQFSVNIPQDVTDIENIEWIQRDELDGKEQMLYHDGPNERTLSIAPQEEGVTTVTTVVTTASGESASAETVVDWASVDATN